MDLRNTALRTLRMMLLVVASAGLVACAQLPQRADLPYAAAVPAASGGAIAARVAPAEAAHPGQSGFRLVSSGAEAYALRMYGAREAVRSLDIQTYIWHADMTGMLLAHHALAAADRGVKVRILVDDMDARAKNTALAALDAHPNIEVRLYNPLASRRGAVSKAGELLSRFGRLNHRMHNKSWIIDNRVALVGGRNLGDEYFQAHESSNFVDLDLVMVGPVVREVSASFDKFWNSPSNYPISQLRSEDASDAALLRLRQALAQAVQQLPDSPYATVLRDDPGVRALAEDTTRLHWTAQWRFVSDDPLKANLPEGQRSNVLTVLGPALQAARSSAHIISPYFVPGDGGTQLLGDSSARGVDVRVLTNSLAATDVAAVHGGYARYRHRLLDDGVQLWELKPNEGRPSQFSLHGSSGSSLHTKAAVFDGQRIFVGSYNLDPRSTSLNCEQGVLVADPALASELEAIFKRESDGSRAWQVSLQADGLRWSDGSEVWSHDPEAGALRRIQAWFVRLLPVESQL